MIKINENGKIFDEGYKLNMSNDIFNDMFVSIENVNIIKFDLLDDFYIVYEKNSYITLNPYISMLIEDDVYVNCKYFYIAHISEINNILQLPSYKLYDYDITSKEIIDYVKTVNYVVDGYIYNELKQTGHIINELEKTNSSCKDLIIETIDSTDCGSHMIEILNNYINNYEGYTNYSPLLNKEDTLDILNHIMQKEINSENYEICAMIHNIVKKIS